MKKLMFNDQYGLTQAVLKGKKTMTRRIAKKLNHPNIVGFSEFGIDNKGRIMLTITYDTGLNEDIYPHFQIGEKVAVAQSYHALNKSGFVAPEWLDHTCEDSAGYNNKMFVRADLMPYRICITNIKLERLQDISDEDIMREGIYKGEQEPAMYGFHLPKGTILSFLSPREAFAELIDRISGKETWERNPWVFAYEFKLIK